MAIARFFLASFLLLFTGFSVFIAGPKKNFDKQDDFDQLCRQFQEKNQKDETAFLQKFPLIDKLFSSKDLVQVRTHPDRLRVNYRSALDRAHNLMDACCRSLKFLTYSCHYTKLYDALESECVDNNFVSVNAGKMGRFFKFDSGDADLVAMNHRMIHFIEHFFAAILTPNNQNYVFSYNPEQDKNFLNGIIANPAVSDEIRQTAQRFIAQGRLYLFQKRAMEGIAEYHRAQNIIDETLKKISTPLTEIVSFDKNYVTGVVDKVSQSKDKNFDESDGINIANLHAKYQSLLRMIDDAIKNVSKEQVVSAQLQTEHKQIASQASKNSHTKKSDKKKRNNKKNSQHNNRTPELVDSKEIEQEQIPNILQELEIASLIIDDVASDHDVSALDDGTRWEIPTVAELEDEAPIKNYFFSTVLNWFSDSTRNRAIDREIERYPSANKTSLQITRNIAAHTFPMAVDKFIVKLAHKFDSVDDTTFYVIPGSLYIHDLKEEQTGYYTWGVAPNGQCFHRSFTLRKFSPKDRLSGKQLYNLDEIEHVLSDSDTQEGTLSGKITPMMRDSLEMVTNGLTVIITDHKSGNIFKLIIPE